MVMELLGPSLEDLFNFCSRRFSLKTTLMLAQQMLHRIEFLHSQGYIHCDMKSENWLMGTDEKANVVHLVDFGLSKQVSLIEDGDPGMMQKMTGTPRYASISLHIGLPNGMRDDLEALGYILIYFLKGKLPWQGHRRKNADFWRVLITQCKIETSVESLTSGLPTEFMLYINYCRSMSFFQRPDYGYLRGLFTNLFLQHNFAYDFEWDWIDRYKEYSLSGMLMPSPVSIKDLGSGGFYSSTDDTYSPQLLQEQGEVAHSFRGRGGSRPRRYERGRQRARGSRVVDEHGSRATQITEPPFGQPVSRARQRGGPRGGPRGPREDRGRGRGKAWVEK
eukprot:TRINITY_DN5065_c0_g1_i2.p1 TRINITY_DN5065_c0_g1~~TRINITY_DN5065_c0_g1_i2.p1  ORF type:complete len:334 (-),score=18.38 TRINITY_DN5065_c0_g1_i2:122-1123(-)